MSAAEHATKDWDHKDLWRKSGPGFLVEVARHNAAPTSLSLGEGPHRWCVYAYIYPKHPHFAKFEGPALFQEAATCMPLHAYPSLVEYPMYDGKVTCVKVGADYHHLHDDGYTHLATREEAWEVFADADNLFYFLKERAAVAGEVPA